MNSISNWNVYKSFSSPGDRTETARSGITLTDRERLSLLGAFGDLPTGSDRSREHGFPGTRPSIIKIQESVLFFFTHRSSLERRWVNEHFINSLPGIIYHFLKFITILKRRSSYGTNFLEGAIFPIQTLKGGGWGWGWGGSLGGEMTYVTRLSRRKLSPFLEIDWKGARMIVTRFTFVQVRFKDCC